MMRRRFLVAAGVAGLAMLLAMLPTLAMCQAYTYTITDLGVVPGGSASGTSATGISDNGYTAGKSDKPAGTPHAFFGTPDSLIDLGVPRGSDFTIGMAVNSNRQVAGYVGTNNGGFTQYPKAARWTIAANGAVSVTTIKPFGGFQCQAYGINDAGQVVGWSSVKSGGMHAFLWDNGTMVDLGGPLAGATSSKATGISNNGVVVGISGPSGWYRRPTDSALIALPLVNAYAVTVAAAGDDIVAGRSASGLPALYNLSTSITTILGAVGGSAHAVNRAGEAAGWSDIGPFVYSPIGGMQALNGSFAQPAGLSWTLQNITGIDGSGRICGWGYTIAAGSTTRVYRAFLLSPN